MPRQSVTLRRILVALTTPVTPDASAVDEQVLASQADRRVGAADRRRLAAILRSAEVLA